MNIVSYAYFRAKASVYESTAWNAKKVGLQFVQFLPMLVRAHHSVWSGWKMAIHHDQRVTQLPYWPAIHGLWLAGLVDLHYSGVCQSICGPSGMLARLDPIYHPCYGASYVACRDIDSVPTPRDRACVEEFIASGKMMHTIHDAPAHCGMMGGLSTFNAPKFKAQTGTKWTDDLVARYGEGIDLDKHGGDQHLLNRMAMSIAPDEILIHELDHEVGDLPGIVRRQVSYDVSWMPPKVLMHGNKLSPVTGGCYAPIDAFDFYDDPELPEVAKIREIEKDCGIDARKLLEEINAL